MRVCLVHAGRDCWWRWPGRVRIRSL